MIADDVAEDLELAALRFAMSPRLEVLQRLGAGGMGAVYLARDPSLNRLVAIKVLTAALDDESARLRFAREAEATAALEHPNIVSVFQVGTLPGTNAPYMVMQYVDGKTLGELFPHDRPASNPAARRIIGEVASALATAHASGLIHRDIKPSNVIVESRTGRAIVVDFGISSVLERAALSPTVSPKLTATGMYIGTPMYMSPEVASGETASAASDVYSLGILGFEIIAGQPPFNATSAMALMAAHLKDRPPSLLEQRADVDPELAHLIDACLAKDTSERPSAEEIARFMLPGAQGLEWPPPGLDALRGAGARMVATLGGCAALLWVLFTAALLQSTRTMACCWKDFEGNSLFGGIRTFLELPISVDEALLTTIYGVVMVVCLVGLPVMLGVAGRRAWRLGTELHRARQAGYPWRVALTTAWDRDRDTAFLRNGTELFAVASEPDRKRFLRLRVVEAGLLAAASLVALALPFLWALGALSVGRPDGAVLTQAEFLFLLAPILVLLVGAALSRHPEGRHRQRARARRPRSMAAPAVRPELVTRWLDAAGLSLTPQRARAVPTKLLLVVAAVLLILPATVVVAFVMGTILFVSSSMPAARAVADSVDRPRLRAEWREMTAFFDSVSALPRWNDERAALFPTALMTMRLREQPYVRLDTQLLGRYPPDTIRLPDTYRSLDARVWNQLPGHLPDELRQRLAADTLSTGLAYWRAFAHSPKPAFLWLVQQTPRAGVTPDGEAGWSPELPYSKFFALMARNLSGAIVAIVRGDNAEALMRARENVAVAWYLKQGTPYAATSRQLIDLTRVARLVGDTALARRATFWEARRRNRSALPLLYFANVDDTLGTSFVADEGLEPFSRLLLAHGAPWAYCLNAREILFGVDPRRLELIKSMKPRLPAAAGIALDEAAAITQRLIDDPVGQFRAFGARHNGTTAIPPLIGLGAASARLSLCQIMTR
jgi:hypothetical protein